MHVETFELVRILALTAVSFILAVALTPILTHFLYKYNIGKQIRHDSNAPIFTKLHKHKEGTPTMGGILIWATTLILVVVFAAVAYLFPGSIFAQFDFLDRGQTFLPLAALLAAALVGLADDILGVWRIGPKGGGIRMRHRVLLYTIIATIGAAWFYGRLDWDLINIPFMGDFNIGAWYIPFFIVVIVATAFSTNETDGLDGLAGGVLMIAFIAYGILAFVEGRYELAAFTAVIAGALLAFLWFNITPARFFMGDTGSMSLGVTLGVIAILTNQVLILPLIAFVMVMESVSVILQLASKKLRAGKKIFKSTPIHHHFEAIGWSEPKVVMRFWIIASIVAGLGVVIGLVG